MRQFAEIKSTTANRRAYTLNKELAGTAHVTVAHANVKYIITAEADLPPQKLNDLLNASTQPGATSPGHLLEYVSYDDHHTNLPEGVQNEVEQLYASLRRNDRTSAAKNYLRRGESTHQIGGAHSRRPSRRPPTTSSRADQRAARRHRDSNTHVQTITTPSAAELLA